MRGFLLVPVLVLAAVGYAACDEGSGIRSWLALRDELERSQTRIAGVRQEIEALRREAAGLESGPFGVERAIREDLGLARPGETIVRTSPSDDSSHRFP